MPNIHDRIQLINARIVDVENGCYFPPQVSLVTQNGKILAMLDFILNIEESPVITLADLLRTATIQSARSMGMDDQFGSIQPGKIAYLVVLDGDPLQDFHLIGKPVQALFMDGNLVINRCGLELTFPNTESNTERI